MRKLLRNVGVLVLTTFLSANIHGQHQNHLDFSNITKVDYGNLPDYLTDEFTVACQIYVPSSSSTEIGKIVSTSVTHTSEQGFNLGIERGYFFTEIFDENYVGYKLENIALVYDEWIDFAFSYDLTGLMKVYINGSCVDSSLTNGSDVNLFSDLFLFGANSWDPQTLKYNGKLDNFRIWNIAKQPDMMVGSCIDMSDSTLIFFEPFNEAGGSEIFEEVNAYKGTIVTNDINDAWQSFDSISSISVDLEQNLGWSEPYFYQLSNLIDSFKVHTGIEDGEVFPIGNNINELIIYYECGIDTIQYVVNVNYACTPNDTITAIEALEYDVNFPICYPDSLGQIIINCAKNGSQFSLNNAQFSKFPVFDNLSSGVYALNVLYLGDTTFVDSIAIVEPTELKLLANVFDEQFGYDGAIELIGQGGSEPYIYNYLNNDTLYELPDNMLDSLPGGSYYFILEDGLGCTDSLQVTIQSFVGVQETTVNGVQLNLAPNPVQDYLIISSNQEIKVNEIKIYNLSGILIKTLRNGQLTLNISTLHNGTYLLEVITQEGSYCQRFVKM